MVKITIYVEGGGNTRNQQSDCRKGFVKFFDNLGFKCSIAIIACGARGNAFKDFCTGLKNIKKNDYCLLLIDSEEPIKNSSVWQHVREVDKWQKPNNATEEQLHFMVESMEAWFMADKNVVASYYGKNFNINALSKNNSIESISKNDLINNLKVATKDTSKGEYSKGNHSFVILSKIDAKKVIDRSFYAKRLHDTIQQFLNTLIPSS